MDENIAAGRVATGHRRHDREDLVRIQIVIATELIAHAGHRAVEIRDLDVLMCLLRGVAQHLSVSVHDPDVDIEKGGDRLHLLTHRVGAQVQVSRLGIGRGDQCRLTVETVRPLPDQVAVGESGGQDRHDHEAQHTEDDIRHDKFYK